MSYFECVNCSFSTDDEALPDCPHCGGYLAEKEEEFVALDESKTMEELYY